MGYRVEISLEISCSPDKLFSFLTDQVKLMQWFAPQVIAAPVQGTVAAFAFEFDLNFKMELVGLEEGNMVAWECVDGYKEWVGSKVRFELEEKDGRTQLHFLHEGLTNDEKKDKTIESWKRYLQKLKEVCEE